MATGDLQVYWKLYTCRGVSLNYFLGACECGVVDGSFDTVFKSKFTHVQVYWKQIVPSCWPQKHLEDSIFDSRSWRASSRKTCKCIEFELHKCLAIGFKSFLHWNPRTNSSMRQYQCCSRSGWCFSSTTWRDQFAKPDLQYISTQHIHTMVHFCKKQHVISS